MGSPFSGMDPYIEASHLWEDFHSKLIGEIERALSTRIPDRYVVRTGERSYVALAEWNDEDEEYAVLPDVAVVSSRAAARATRKPKESPRVVDKSEPGAIAMRALVKAAYREPYLEIRQLDPHHKLITAIEVLSPSNKRRNSKGWRLYYRKRLAFLRGYANLVEIDFLRRGRRMPMASTWPKSPYYMLVCRKKLAPRCSVWPAHFQKPLPAIPIPLAPPDADISLDIQPLVEAVYARSRYQRDIDYRQPLYPPLSRAEAAWVEKRLRDGLA